MLSAHTASQNYNGWANYETWCVDLWLSNTRADYFSIQELIADQTDIAAAAEAIKAYVEAVNPLPDQASLFADLLNAALRAVDWVEIAQAFRED